MAERRPEGGATMTTPPPLRDEIFDRLYFFLQRFDFEIQRPNFGIEAGDRILKTAVFGFQFLDGTVEMLHRTFQLLVRNLDVNNMTMVGVVALLILIRILQ